MDTSQEVTQSTVDGSNDTTSDPPAAKKQKLNEPSTSGADNNSPEAAPTDEPPDSQDLVKSLESIEDIQSHIEELNEKANQEILQIEMKYNKLRRPHYEKRNTFISTIDNFWITVFLNHPRMANLIVKEDEAMLQHLTQIDVVEFPDIQAGFEIKFHFSSNPFFSNDVLTKTYYLSGCSGDNDELYVPSKSTEINWKISRRKGGGRSFFMWYSLPTDASTDKVVEMLKDDMYLNPVQYYLAASDENDVQHVEPVQHADDDSVVIVGDDSDEDDDCYEVTDDSDEFESSEELEETVESIEVDDDDDDSDVQVIDSDSEPEVHHVDNDDGCLEVSGPSTALNMAGQQNSWINKIVADAVETFEKEDALKKRQEVQHQSFIELDGKSPEVNKGKQLPSSSGETSSSDKGKKLLSNSGETSNGGKGKEQCDSASEKSVKVNEKVTDGDEQTESSDKGDHSEENEKGDNLKRKGGNLEENGKEDNSEAKDKGGDLVGKGDSESSVTLKSAGNGEGTEAENGAKEGVD